MWMMPDRIEYPNKDDKNWMFPVRPVVMGGDDLTVIMRGDLGLYFASKYMKYFSEVASQHQGYENITASVGVAIVHDGYPFSVAVRLAEDLCRYAKNKLRDKEEVSTEDGKTQKFTPAALMFMRSSFSSSDGLDSYLENELSKHIDDKTHRLYMGPYTLKSVDGFAKLSHLENLASIIDEFPSGSLRQAVGLMLSEPDKAEQLMNRQSEMLHSSGKADVWKSYNNLLAEFPQGEEDSNILGWRTLGDVKDTPIFDALSYNRALSESWPANKSKGEG